MNDVLLVASAADYAARQHACQRRKGKAAEPYVNHLAEVAGLLAVATDGKDAALVALGWLHDAVEDTNSKPEDIAHLFGNEMAALVAEVTDDKSLDKAVRKQRQVEMAPHKSPRAKMLKIADKTSNLRSLVASPPDHWDRDRLTEYVIWAERVVSGCRGVNARLDRVFDEAAAEARRAT